MDCGGELVSSHHEAAISNERDNGFLRSNELGGDSGRHAVSHGTVRRPQESAELGKLVKPLWPAREVSGVEGDDGILRQSRADRVHNLVEIDIPGRFGCLKRFEVVITSGLDPVAPCHPVKRLQCLYRSRELRHGSNDCEIGLIDPAHLIGIGIDVNQRRLRTGRLQECVTFRRDIAQPCTDGKHEIRLTQAFRNLGVFCVGQIPRVGRMAVIEQVLAAEVHQCRYVVCFGECRQVVASL